MDFIINKGSNIIVTKITVVEIRNMLNSNVLYDVFKMIEVSEFISFNVLFLVAEHP